MATLARPIKGLTFGEHARPGTLCGRCGCRTKNYGCSCSCHRLWCDCHGERHALCIQLHGTLQALADPRDTPA